MQENKRIASEMPSSGRSCSGSFMRGRREQESKTTQGVERRSQEEAAAGPSCEKEEDGSQKQCKELNRRAQDGAADPSSDEDDGSRKRRMESNRRAQDGAADLLSDDNNRV